ncbi:ABC transporter permease [Cecembia calidifontis]|jgi:lipoprotein-releasing system permease protein|uniref:Lipoprotein-releasing system permease protein n=1 Tax=Cecembia calidifontis TaxID=1187080 RepID=A0A4V2F712_9BACT|nr:FtsX-like permease family protein [Cecembia calidifontis]RZS98209.1 lipoprotein-releasing system permease protein [Cecembia calidifontis]
MRFALIVEIAKALMMARIKQTMVAAVGVTFSITMFIALLGFMNGLNDLLDGLILNRTAHVRFYNDIKPNEEQPISLSEEFKGFYNIVRSVKPSVSRVSIHNNQAIIRTLKEDKRILGVASKIAVQAFFNVGNVDIPAVLNGIEVEEENRLFAFSDYVVSGNFMDLHYTSNSIILGKGAADKMMAEIGDYVQVTTAQGNRLLLKVVGYYQSGIGELDNLQSYVSLATAQKMLGETSSYITDIQVKLYDLDLSPALAKEYRSMFGIDADDIQTVNAQFETGSNVRSLISYAVGITLLVVSGFGIYNILNMMIYEKMDTIAILKAIGFSGKDVRNVFISIAVSIGFFGGLMGLFFGFLACLGIERIPFETEALPTIKTYPVNFNPKYYVIGAVFSLVTTYFAGFFPSLKASRVDPVEIIRGK